MSDAEICLVRAWKGITKRLKHHLQCLFGPSVRVLAYVFRDSRVHPVTERIELREYRGALLRMLPHLFQIDRVQIGKLQIRRKANMRALLRLFCDKHAAKGMREKIVAAVGGSPHRPRSPGAFLVIFGRRIAAASCNGRGTQTDDQGDRAYETSHGALHRPMKCTSS
jgi:hypothetical protein